eukprot:gene26280-17377_t
MCVPLEASLARTVAAAAVTRASAAAVARGLSAVRALASASSATIASGRDMLVKSQPLSKDTQTMQRITESFEAYFGSSSKDAFENMEDINEPEEGGGGGGSDLSDGAIAGIVVGVSVFCILATATIVFFVMRKSQGHSHLPYPKGGAGSDCVTDVTEHAGVTGAIRVCIPAGIRDFSSTVCNNFFNSEIGGAQYICVPGGDDEGCSRMISNNQADITNVGGIPPVDFNCSVHTRGTKLSLLSLVMCVPLEASLARTVAAAAVTRASAEAVARGLSAVRALASASSATIASGRDMLVESQPLSKDTQTMQRITESFQAYSGSSSKDAFENMEDINEPEEGGGGGGSDLSDGAIAGIV